jgi:hypothetical protein
MSKSRFTRIWDDGNWADYDRAAFEAVLVCQLVPVSLRHPAGPAVLMGNADAHEAYR